MAFSWRDLYDKGFHLDKNFAAAGLYEGVSVVRKFGHAPGTSTSTVTLWSATTLYTYPSSATVLKVSSADANDTAAGTGARTVQIYGLDADYNEINETITLNGKTAVNTTLSFLRVFRMIVRSAGTGGSNAGKVYAGAGTVILGVPATVYAEVDIGFNQSLMALYTIPAGKKALLRDTHFTMGAGKTLDSYLAIRPLGEVFQVRHEGHIFEVPYIPRMSIPLSIDEKSDIELRVKIDEGTAEVSGGFSLLLLDKK